MIQLHLLNLLSLSIINNNYSKSSWWTAFFGVCWNHYYYLLLINDQKRSWFFPDSIAFADFALTYYLLVINYLKLCWLIFRFNDFKELLIYFFLKLNQSKVRNGIRPTILSICDGQTKKKRIWLIKHVQQHSPPFSYVNWLFYVELCQQNSLSVLFCWNVATKLNAIDR